MKIKVDLWITPDGYGGEIIPGVGVAQHVKGTVEMPEAPAVALLAAILSIGQSTTFENVKHARRILEEASVER